MTGGYIIFIGLVVLVLIYTFVYRKTYFEPFISYTVEDTQAKAACSPKTLVKDPVKPDAAQLGVGTVKPAKETGSLPWSSYKPSRAAVLPYRNPGTEPARYIQVLSAMEQIQAFFGFEAPALESECSPTVALPLQQARADLAQLVTQVDVLERNPGVPSVITTKELTSIMSNVRYLQKEARKIKANSGTELLGANASAGQVHEGFASQRDARPSSLKMSEGFLGTIDDSTTIEEEVASTPATQTQLIAFKTAIEQSITTLKKSTADSTDAVTTARLASLDRLRRDVEDIIVALENGDIKAEEVPIYYEDIQAVSEKLGDTSNTIGTIIRNVALPPALAKLFPADMNWKDKITLSEIGKSIDTYMGELTDGMSWSAKGDIGVELKYDSPRSLELAQAQKALKSISTNGDMTNTAFASSGGSVSSPFSEDGSMIDPVASTGYEGRISGLNPDGTRIMMAEPTVGGFDWKERAGHICASIKKAGMEPKMFGCVDPKDVSDAYSWRGNVALLCNRLKSSTDPGLPISMGCPPDTFMAKTH